MLTVCAISDTHNNHSKLLIPSCDILIHCGDATGIGSLQETKSFLEWYSKQLSTYKLLISGNHCGLSYEQPSLFKELLKEYPNITYLQDEGITIEGINFWGRPWTPTFNDWFWMADPGSPKMLATFEVIPPDTDVLITHGPPYQILDLTASGEHVGCKDMRNWMASKDKLPGFILCGHIHNCGQKTYLYGDTTVINCAVLDDNYNLVFKPTIFHL